MIPEEYDSFPASQVSLAPEIWDGHAGETSLRARSVGGPLAGVSDAAQAGVVALVPEGSQELAGAGEVGRG
jgi:hypothetical protein